MSEDGQEVKDELQGNGPEHEGGSTWPFLKDHYLPFSRSSFIKTPLVALPHLAQLP